MSSVNEILNDLNSLKSDIQVYIPSSKSNKKTKTLNLKQQKELLDNLSESNLSLLTFFNDVFEIINANCSEDSKVINVIDRPNILLSLRCDINKIYEEVNLEELLKRNKDISLPDLSKQIETEHFVFDVSSPSIQRDYNVNSYLVNTYKNEEKILGKLYINELSKFINKIKFKSSEKVIDFDNESNGNRFKILENMQSSNFQEIYTFINDIRDKEVEYLTLDGTQIDLSPEFFVL
tara:strand:+ start:1730 stop:2434 length:705 start_codon:yes stop_codon:yes gene_type:complete